MFPESCSVLDAVTAATLALLGLSDREICDAAGGPSRSMLSDLLGDAAEVQQAVDVPEIVRVIVQASGIDIAAAKAAFAAAKNPPAPVAAAASDAWDSGRERRDSTISNVSGGSNQDSEFHFDSGRISPVNPHISFAIRSANTDSSAAGAHAAAIAPPPAPATQVGGVVGGDVCLLAMKLLMLLQRRRGSVVDI